jgi:hypothetical protein
MARKRLSAILVIVAVGAFSLGLANRVFGSAQVVTTTSPILGHPISELAPGHTFPRKGTDSFESIAEIQVQQYSGGCNGPVYGGGAAGPVTVRRLAPQEDANHRAFFNTEMLSMSLQGYVPGMGPVMITESQSQASTGMVKEVKAGPQDFPADSFFDIFIEVQLPSMPPLHNQQPLHVTSRITGIPPIGSEYRGPQTPTILFDNATPVLCILDVSHVPEDPSHVLMKKELMQIQWRLDEICAEQIQQPNCPPPFGS